MLNCIFFMSSGLVRGCLMRRLILVIFDQGVQFQCRLFLFGPGMDIWRSCRFIGALMRSLSACSLGGLVGSCLALLVLTIADLVMLGGRSVVMVLLLDLVRVPRSLSWMSPYGFLIILLGSARVLIAGTLPLRFCAGARSEVHWVLDQGGQEFD